MRQRKAKNFDNRMNALKRFLIEEPAEVKNAFQNGNEVFVELGCGKGQFVFSCAAAHPNCNYIGIEGQDTVILRALERYAEQRNEDNCGTKADNLRFACMFVHDIRELFPQESVSGIFLNFSDPWPKARHAKRRLTHRNMLLGYAGVLKPGGFVEFKTDNDVLFDFSLSEAEQVTDIFRIDEMTRDLKESEFMSEYEQKFRAAGKNINFLRLVKR